MCAHTCARLCAARHTCVFSLKGWRVMAHCWKHFSVFITRQQGTKPTVSFEDYQALWWGSRHCKAVRNRAFLRHGVIGAPAVPPAPQQLSNEVTGEALGPRTNPAELSGQTSVDSSGEVGSWSMCAGTCPVGCCWTKSRIREVSQELKVLCGPWSPGRDNMSRGDHENKWGSSVLLFLVCSGKLKYFSWIIEEKSDW